jgi:retron-type reverse transcriptase
LARIPAPQGGPLSPLLAKVLLDEVDKELEKRGHAFVRCADDCTVYVSSKRAGQRVMALLRKLYGNLKLKVNESKSAVELAVCRLQAMMENLRGYLSGWKNYFVLLQPGPP